MKTELERSDIEIIAQQLADKLKPLLCNSFKQTDDIIFDVKGLAQYLKVGVPWVYGQVHLKTIPYFKVGKYTRFKKAVIDKWIERETVQPIPPITSLKR
jgi:excisionase family DNA binding protein